MQNLEPVMGLQGVTKLGIINFMILTSILEEVMTTAQDYCQADSSIKILVGKLLAN